jgi:hypothetical protein
LLLLWFNLLLIDAVVDAVGWLAGWLVVQLVPIIQAAIIEPGHLASQ